jgi:hypothetical protein
MEKVIIIKTNDVIYMTWYYGAYGVLFLRPFFSREGVNICRGGDLRAMDVFWHVGMCG